MKLWKVVFFVMLLSLCCGSAQAAIPQDGLILSYNFDSDSTTIVDQSSNSHNGTATDPNFVTGYHGNGLYIDNDTGSIITVPDSDDLDLYQTDFSICFNVKPINNNFNSNPSNTYFLAKDLLSTNNNGYYMRLNTLSIGHMQLGLTNGTAREYEADTSLNDWSDDWNHIVVTYNHTSQTVSFYKNLELAGQLQYTDITNTSNISYPNAGNLTIFGPPPNVSPQVYQSAVFDDFAIYNKILNETEINLVAFNGSIYPENNYYIDGTNGNDANDGLTIATAKKTIQAGVNLAVLPGDTVYIADGNYADVNTSLNYSGAAGYPISITAYNGTPHITGTDNHSQQGFYTIEAQSYISISDLWISHFAYGITNGNYPSGNGGGNNWYIDNVTIDSNCGYVLPENIGTGGCIYFRKHGNDSIIENCRLNNSSGHTLMVHNGDYDASPLTNITVKNNYINSYNHNGLELMGLIYNSSIENNYITCPSPYINSRAIYVGSVDSRNNRIVNNTLFNVSGPAICLDNADNITVENNTFTQIDDYALQLLAASSAEMQSWGWTLEGVSNSTVRNNIFSSAVGETDPCVLYYGGVYNETKFGNNSFTNNTINMDSTALVYHSDVFNDSYSNNSLNIVGTSSGDELWVYNFLHEFLFNIGADAERTSPSTEYILYTSSHPLPLAAFSANNTTGTAPCDIQFWDNSSQSPLTWAWDFDNDGAIDSTEQNPIYTYTSDGSFDVNLTVTNAIGSDTEIKTDYVILTNPYVAPIILTSVAAAVLFMMARRRW